MTITGLSTYRTQTLKVRRKKERENEHFRFDIQKFNKQTNNSFYVPIPMHAQHYVHCIIAVASLRRDSHYLPCDLITSVGGKVSCLNKHRKIHGFK